MKQFINVKQFIHDLGQLVGVALFCATVICVALIAMSPFLLAGK